MIWSLSGRVALSFIFALSMFMPSRAAPKCDIRPAMSWYTTITAGGYQLLFDEDDDTTATPHVEHAPHGDIFITTDTDSFRIKGPSSSCWASYQVGIVTMPLFIGNGRYLYIPTYSGGDAYLFVVDAQSCKTLWQSPDLDGGDAVRTDYGFWLPGVGRAVIGRDCLPRLTKP